MIRLPRIPDVLTTANLACGVGAIMLASQGQLTVACWLVFLGAFFDVLDGLAARALGGGTPLGAQLDSLADMVTFGVAPAMIAAIDPVNALDRTIWQHLDHLPAGAQIHGSLLVEPLWMAAAIAIIISVASCWRLAKFNTDSRQTHGFLGLATPANALFWASMGIASWGLGVNHGPGYNELMNHVVAFMSDPTRKLILATILGVLMVSEIPLPSLKFKQFKWQGNQVIYLLVGIGILLVLLYGILGVPLILLLYLLSPIWGKLFPTTP